MEKRRKLNDLINEYINYIDIKPETKRGYKKILEEYSTYISKVTDSPNRSDLIKLLEVNNNLTIRQLFNDLRKHEIHPKISLIIIEDIKK